MGSYDRFQFWNVNAAEREATYPSDRYAEPGSMRFLRAISIDTDAATVFRWLCQLKVAPYSYDWLDNLGRRSPRRLTPGAERLAVGQRFLVSRIVEFEHGRHITGVETAAARALFGPMTLSYQVTACGPAASRLVACLTVGAAGRVGRARRRLLGAGDLLMMRKQLLTLKECAEQSRPSQSSPKSSRPLRSRSRGA